MKNKQINNSHGNCRQHYNVTKSLQDHYIIISGYTRIQRSMFNSQINYIGFTTAKCVQSFVIIIVIMLYQICTCTAWARHFITGGRGRASTFHFNPTCSTNVDPSVRHPPLSRTLQIPCAILFQLIQNFTYGVLD